jgi:hypothetical protein
VLFAVLSGARVSGPGRCTPGPIDCEVLSLGQGQVENVASSSAAAAIAEISVTQISVDRHPSAAAAQRTRRSASANGRALVAKANLSVLHLFKYDPGLGAVVDERNLTVGGS